MKLLAYILAFYLIGLAVVPCCSFDSCPDDKTEQAMQHESGDKDCGNCSPFFSCEGCAAATIDSSHHCIEIPSLTAQTVFASYQQPFISAVDYDFWQPPKIS